MCFFTAYIEGISGAPSSLVHCRTMTFCACENQRCGELKRRCVKNSYMCPNEAEKCKTICIHTGIVFQGYSGSLGETWSYGARLANMKLQNIGMLVDITGYYEMLDVIPDEMSCCPLILKISYNSHFGRGILSDLIYILSTHLLIPDHLWHNPTITSFH